MPINNRGDSAANENGHRARSAQSAAGSGAENNGGVPLFENPLAPPLLSDTALHGLIGEVVNNYLDCGDLTKGLPFRFAPLLPEYRQPVSLRSARAYLLRELQEIHAPAVLMHPSSPSGLRRDKRAVGGVYPGPRMSTTPLEQLFRVRVTCPQCLRHSRCRRVQMLAEEFIAAITQHIPDKGFQMVRYYGW